MAISKSGKPAAGSRAGKAAASARSVKPARKLRGDFNIGGQAAEADLLLGEAFYETGQYLSTVSKDDRRCFLIGRTGSGKSAILQALQASHGDHVIRIDPEDLSLPYITDLGVVKYLSDLDVHLDPLFNMLWKHVLLIEIIKHRYKVDSPDAKLRFLDMIMEKIKRDKSKQAALAYLDEFEGKFWQETYQRVREITQSFENQVNAQAGASVTFHGTGITAKAGNDEKAASSERTELVNRFQRVVNETQLPRLNQMMKVLDEDILDSSQNFTYIVIDDLDRDWADEKIANMLIRNLFQVVLSLQRVENLKVLVALRTNIFEALDFGRTGGQEEKFRAQTLRIFWTKSDLVQLLNKRVEIAAQRSGLDGATRISDLLPSASNVRGGQNALEYILDRTLMRPRDAIAFINECVALSTGKARLSWDGIRAAETSYSNNRLLALRDEWKPTFPGIEQVLRVFSGSPPELDHKALTKRLDDCVLLVANPSFEGTVWMTERGVNPIFYGSADDWAEMYQPLVRLLYNIGFIGCVRKGGSAVYSHDEPDYVDRLTNVRETRCFTIHPAFRPTLDIRE